MIIITPRLGAEINNDGDTGNKIEEDLTRKKDAITMNRCITREGEQANPSSWNESRGSLARSLDLLIV